MAANNSEWLEEGATTNTRKPMKEVISKYLSYLPLFILSLALCIGAGLMYLKYAVPKYNVSTYILVKTNVSKTSAMANGQEDLVTTILNGGKEVLLDNEVALIKSNSLMEKVVLKNLFNVSYYPLNKFQKAELYHTAPFRLVPQDKDTCQPFSITVKDITGAGATIVFANGKEFANTPYKWNDTFKVNGKKFILVPENKEHAANDAFVASWNSVEKTSDKILDNLSVDILDKKTTILQIALITENISRGEDILNSLWKEYIAQNIEEKDAISQSTIHFIDDRLTIISQELSGVEGNLEDYQGTNQLINVQSQSTQSLTNASEVSKDITGLNIQQNVVDMLQNYVSNPQTENNPVPSNLGITDPTLASLILKYNELQIKKQRETPLLAPNSLILQDINNQVNSLKQSILENLQNIKKNLQLQEVSLQQKNQQYNKFLSALPHKERVIQNIKRKQSITEGLYLYLLQKREEAVISASTSNISNYKQIDAAKGSEKPVQPKPSLVLILSVLVGLLIPISWMRLRENLNDKVMSGHDISNRAKIPVLGEVYHIKRSKEDSVLKDAGMGEDFRKIRTNISMSHKKKNKQVILVTSSADGEGKTTIAKNLAAIFAITGKKVALLDFNFNKADGEYNSAGTTKGLTDYLNGDTNGTFKIAAVSGEIPSLYIYPRGSDFENPSDLLLKKTLPELLNSLRQEFEHIVIDATATGVASDAFILGEYSDLVLYVIREKFTKKNQVDFLNELAVNEKLNNIGIIFNDVHAKNKFSV